MPFGAVRGEDEGLGDGVRFDGEVDGRVGVGEVVEEDGTMIFVLLVEFVVLRASGGIVGEFPVATHSAAGFELGRGEVVF